MLLWITIGLLVLGAALWALAEHFEWYGTETVTKFITGIVIVALVIECIVFAAEYINVKSQVAADRQEFESLYYQYEAVMTDTEYTRGHYELMSDIAAWNKSLAWHQTAQHDFWIGPFVPDVYDSYEYITINMFMKADYEEDEP